MGERSLAVVAGGDLDIFTERRLKLIREKFANDAPPEEFEIFIEFCKARQLDPLQRQAYLIPRYDKKLGRKAWSIQTSIDGYRAIADRTGAYAGSDDAVFTERGGELSAATVTVWKIVQGVRCPFTATARLSEYQSDSPLWSRMPHTMLAKCAESLALRKAFPSQLGGLYTTDEMAQATAMPATIVETAAGAVDAETGEIVKPAETPRQRAKSDHERAMSHYMAACADAGLEDAASKLLALALFPDRPDGATTSRKQLTGAELDDLAGLVKDKMPAPNPLVDFANLIAVADQTALARLAADMKANGITDDFLRAMWRARNRQAPAATAALVDAPVADGSAGDDRFTA